MMLFAHQSTQTAGKLRLHHPTKTMLTANLRLTLSGTGSATNTHYTVFTW